MAKKLAERTVLLIRHGETTDNARDVFAVHRSGILRRRQAASGDHG